LARREIPGKAAIAPKALLLANGAKDAIDIESIKKFVKDLRPSYEAYPGRLELLEEPKTGHVLADHEIFPDAPGILQAL
jgi:hypothetical protein